MKNLKIFIPVAAVVILLALVGSLFFNKKTAVPSVVSTQPAPGEQDVLESRQIDIIFAEDIKDKAKQDISVSLDPETSFNSTWLTNTYKIIPKSNLNSNTTYKVKVNYKDKEIFNFSFSTQIFSQEDIKKYGPDQTKDDYDFGQTLTQIVNKYPFYPNLPIKDKDYVVYYDFEKDKFAITFLTDNLDSRTKQELILKAIDRIKQIGGKDPIQYYTQP